LAASSQVWSGRRLRLLFLVGVGVSVLVVQVASAVVGKVHSRRVDACSLLKAGEVSSAVRYTVMWKEMPAIPDHRLGTIASICDGTEAHANRSSGARNVELFVQQRDFSNKSSTWSARAAKKQFAHLRAFEAPVVPVKGLGDAAMWSPSGGAIYVLSGDLILNINGQTGPRKRGQQVAASESVDIALMRKALART
jgi:hypothetical protein